MAILCAWWYYDDFVSILDDINLKLKGKNDDEIKEILSQFDFKAKNEYFYFNKILLGKSVNIRLELKDDEVIEIMVVRF